MARSNGKETSNALRDRLRNKLYARREMDIGGETTEFWIRKLSPAIYMELFGSVFADLRATEEGYEPDTPNEAAKNLLVMDKVCIAGTRAEDDKGEPTKEPLFDEEILAALTMSEKGALANEILEFSGISGEAAKQARTFRKTGKSRTKSKTRTSRKRV